MSKSAQQNKHETFVRDSEQLVVKLLRAAGADDKNEAVVIDVDTREAAKTELDADKKALNSMASIIGGGGSGAVGAVCYDGNKFLLSTNQPEDKNEVQKLFNLIKEKDHDQLSNEVYAHAVLNVEKHFSEKLFLGNLDKVSKIQSIKEDLQKHLIKKLNEYQTIQSLPKQIEALEELSLLANEVLTTCQDELAQKAGLRNFLTDLYTPAKHIERITGYKKGEKAELFTHEPQFVARENTHAEMNILNELFMQGKLLGERQFFIGDTKKCCASCHIVVTSVNQILLNKIEMSGTHGKAYIPWQKPEFLRLNKQELENALAARGHQSGQINVLVKLAADINSTFEAKMKGLIEEVQTRGTQPLPERQARSVSPLAHSEVSSPKQSLVQSQKIIEMTQEEREQQNLVNEKRENAQRLNGELSILQNSFTLPEEEKKLSNLKENLKKVQSTEKILNSRLYITKNNIDKCIKTQEEQKTKQELYKRYELQLQTTKEVWADSPVGEVKSAGIIQINRAEELLTTAKEDLLAANKAVESIFGKDKEFNQALQIDNERKRKLLVKKTKIEEQIRNLNTEIKSTQEKLKNKLEERNKAIAEWEAEEKKLIQIQNVGKKEEESIASQPKNPQKRRIKGSGEEEPLIKKAQTGEVELKPKDIPLPIAFPGQQAAISPAIEAKKREEVQQEQTFTLVEYPRQNVQSLKKRVSRPHHLDNEESLPINKKQKLTKAQPLKPEVMFPPIELSWANSRAGCSFSRSDGYT